MLLSIRRPLETSEERSVPQSPH